MTATTHVGPPPRVSTAGAWLGLLVATWAALTVAWHVFCLGGVAAAPSVVDRIAVRAEEEAAGAGVPAQFSKLIDLAFEGLRLFAAYARIVDGSGVALGVALFVAAFALVQGSETGRRAARTLLVAKALHSVAAAAWLVVLADTSPTAWCGRFVAAFEEVAKNAPHGAPAFGARISEWSHAAPQAVVVGAVVSVAVTAVLFRLAGGCSARDWCAARSGRSPIASAPPPR